MTLYETVYKVLLSFFSHSDQQSYTTNTTTVNVKRTYNLRPRKPINYR